MYVHKYQVHETLRRAIDDHLLFLKVAISVVRHKTRAMFHMCNKCLVTVYKPNGDMPRLFNSNINSRYNRLENRASSTARRSLYLRYAQCNAKLMFIQTNDRQTRPNTRDREVIAISAFYPTSRRASWPTLIHATSRRSPRCGRKDDVANASCVREVERVSH